MREGVIRWAVRLHKWLALLVALQVVFWVLGGFVMTLLPIERVRGEHHAPEAPATAIDVARVVPLSALASGAFDSARLERTPRGVVWVLAAGETRRVHDASTGALLPALTAEQARGAAMAGYVGDGRPAATHYLAVAPVETGREGPMWRVGFDDAEATRLYLDPLTGAVVSRRSDLWAFFDFWWRLHILDFGEGDDINNPLIVTLAGLTVAMTLAGLVLLWARFLPGREKPDQSAMTRR